MEARGGQQIWEERGAWFQSRKKKKKICLNIILETILAQFYLSEKIESVQCVFQTQVTILLLKCTKSIFATSLKLIKAFQGHFLCKKTFKFLMIHLSMIFTDLSRSLSPCDLLYKHSCSSPSCRSCRHLGYHTAALRRDSPLGGDRERGKRRRGQPSYEAPRLSMASFPRVTATHTSDIGHRRIPPCTDTSSRCVCSHDTLLRSDTGWTRSRRPLHACVF